MTLQINVTLWNEDVTTVSDNDLECVFYLLKFTAEQYNGGSCGESCVSQPLFSFYIFGYVHIVKSLSAKASVVDREMTDVLARDLKQWFDEKGRLIPIEGSVSYEVVSLLEIINERYMGYSRVIYLLSLPPPQRNTSTVTERWIWWWRPLPLPPIAEHG